MRILWNHKLWIAFSSLCQNHQRECGHGHCGDKPKRLFFSTQSVTFAWPWRKGLGGNVLFVSSPDFCMLMDAWAIVRVPPRAVTVVFQRQVTNNTCCVRVRPHRLFCPCCTKMWRSRVTSWLLDVKMMEIWDETILFFMLEQLSLGIGIKLIKLGFWCFSRFQNMWNSSETLLKSSKVLTNDMQEKCTSNSSMPFWILNGTKFTLLVCCVRKMFSHVQWCHWQCHCLQTKNVSAGCY